MRKDTEAQKIRRAALDRFDSAAQGWGWQSDMGYGAAVTRSEAEYKAAKSELEKALKLPPPTGVKP